MTLNARRIEKGREIGAYGIAIKILASKIRFSFVLITLFFANFMYYHSKCCMNIPSCQMLGEFFPDLGKEPKREKK